MDTNSLSKLNGNPRAKLDTLKKLLAMPNISSTQQSRIFRLIKEAETELLTSTQYPRQPSQPPQQYIPARQPPSQPSLQYIPARQPPQNMQNTQNIQTRYPGANQLVAIPDKKMSSVHFSQQYYTEEQLREQEFERELIRRREEFKADQVRRRNEYLKSLQELDQGNVDSLKLFSLNPNYTLDELKKAYKQKAIETHPDRPGGNTEKFQIVTKCYMSLLERLKSKNSGENSAKQYTDLKSASNDWNNKPGSNNSKMPGQGQGPLLTPDGKNFNNALFNKLYESNKLWDPSDDGYEDWLRTGSVDAKDKTPPVFSKSFNVDIFNATFEDWKDNSDGNHNNNTNRGQITQYDKPMELISTGVGFSSLDGATPIKDFTKPLDAAGSLNYTDLKAAYTGACNMVNPRDVKARAEYRNVDDLKRDRENISFHLSPEDRAREEHLAEMTAREELSRQERMKQRDLLTSNHYGAVHERLLGYAAASDNPAIALARSDKNNSIPQLSYSGGQKNRAKQGSLPPRDNDIFAIGWNPGS